MKAFGVLVVVATCLVLAASMRTIDDKIISSYGTSLLMRDCFGERNYVRYMNKLHAAQAACSAKPYVPQPHYTTRPTAPHYLPYRSFLFSLREKDGFQYFNRENNGFQYFNREKVHDLSMKMRMSVANSTCVLLEMGYIDESYNILTENMIDEIKEVGRIDKELMQDLITGIKDCHAFTTCIPYDNMQYPMTANTMRYLNFNVCRENANLFACIKKDVRKRSHEFDLIGAGVESDRLTADDKIFSMLWVDATGVSSFKKF
ncbi:hypothetical protein FHG87_001701 [Trinorchestia longiramus]|nr:hypothetical protein FHG87_001701 [Trinorchestia longiramus]